MGQKPQESSVWLFAHSLYPTVNCGAMCENAYREGKSLYRGVSHLGNLRLLTALPLGLGTGIPQTVRRMSLF